VASQGQYELDLFWMDSSNNLRQLEWNNGWVQSPSNPANLGPSLAAPGTKPVAVSWGPGRIDVFQIANTPGGTQLYHKASNNGSWGGWSNVNMPEGGPTSSTISSAFDVAVSSWGPGRIDVFAISYAREVWHTAYDSTYPNGWWPWEDLGGYATSAPAAASWASGRIDMVVRGGDNGVYHKAWAGAWYPSQLGYEYLGGGNAFGPGGVAISSYQPNRLDVFAGSRSSLAHLTYDNAWTSWWNMGPTVPEMPVSMSWGPEPGSIDLFARDVNGALWQMFSQ
jgi:hypothetical protein